MNYGEYKRFLSNKQEEIEKHPRDRHRSGAEKIMLAFVLIIWAWLLLAASV